MLYREAVGVAAMIKIQDTSIDPMWDYLISARKMCYGCLREKEEFEM